MVLHRIELPDCRQHLEWVVRLQDDLLQALCDPGLAAGQVTADWVATQRPDIDPAWIQRFCGWKQAGRSVLARMQAVAGLPAPDRQALLDHYRVNLRFHEAFDENPGSPPPTTPLPERLSAPTAGAYRNFFEMFYAPIFYRDKGYPIDAEDLNGEPFTKDHYLHAYRATNDRTLVCPTCDGSMDGAELDHWLARRHLPELNCHPENLVEICSACNGPANKGQKLALDGAAPDPFDNWFHPHLRSAAGAYEISVENGNPRLVSPLSKAQTRLDTFTALVNLSTRWKDEYRAQFKGIGNRIRNHRRRGKLFEELSLMAQLQGWHTDAEAEQGIRPDKLLETALLSGALDTSSPAFAEFLAYATADT